MCSDGSKYPGTMAVPLGDVNDRSPFQQEGKLMISVRPSWSLKLGYNRNLWIEVGVRSVAYLRVLLKNRGGWKAVRGGHARAEDSR